MRFITSLFGNGSPKTMGRQYMKVGRNALLGIKPNQKDGICSEKVPTPLSMLISRGGKLKHSRIAAICFGLLALIIGIVLSSIPWVDYIILKQLRLWNGSLSFQYWQKPGVVRLTKVYIFNMTNTEGFLQFNEKPKLQEIGPFVYREDMEKVNIVFHNNGTVTYQHKKILNFVPEMSRDGEVKVMVPNIPLLTLSTQSKSLPRFITIGLSMFLSGMQMKPFIPLTVQELVFGYDDPLVSIAHRFFPISRRPMSKIGILNGRNGTLTEVSTIYTGHTDMKVFGLINRLNGLDHLPYWPEAPCNSIIASEGSFFPPRDKTGSDIVHIWDKDLCRVLPLQYRGPVKNSSIKADLYTPPEMVFGLPDDNNPENKCFCSDDFSTCPKKGLQNISPCQYTAPVYISFPHFYQADTELLDAVLGLKPVPELHETYFKIQPKLGVPIEGKVRVQINLKVERQPNIGVVANFPDIVFPIMWLEEGIEELTPSIRRWVYLATTFADIAVPCVSYGLILVGLITIIVVFVKAYNNVVFTHEAIELGKRTIRRGSSFLVNQQHRLLVNKDSNYVLLSNDIEEISTDVVV
ncbi:scavenger receptor class B member 1-like [Vespa mandarinia]|uniref:scavenger receptor class B member 1-like n=1 Tax=Vespa mandarinia TaxID=7446 RepID=UPI0016092ACF|nr:scavenger receptor class B member 1-like [Vespa mandarinia]XP_035719199.1 scavenger receptor class B member 1-like [Vespa mandarinia]XP_035719200.1 scavenger receptor class B member 1-like [Vespa mandarinia]XP_035719201.1 scavenger receptor class B member 1-like [Vespa mandarinia]XP_035719202.1 scavenger receptor class B member 1-like [Vespa mandarinia]